MRAVAGAALATISTARRVAVCAVVAMALVVGVAGDSYAHLRSHNDGDDVAGPFDLRNVALERQDGTVLATVRTYGLLRDRYFLTGDAFYVKFDSRGDSRADFTLRMDYYEGSYAFCTLYDREGFSRYGTYGTKRHRAFACEVPWGELEATRHIRWRVVSVSGGRVDRAPNRGWFSH